MRLIDADAIKYDTIGCGGWGLPEEVVSEYRISKIPAIDAVILPCKIGDSVWGIRTYHKGKRVRQGIVSDMLFVGPEMQLCICVKNVCRGEWGKTVFATREEAEAAVEKFEKARSIAT